MDNKDFEQRITILEKEVESLKKLIGNGRIDCGYFDND